MPTFRYANPPVIHWGAGSVKEVAGELAALGVTRVALVTTKSLLGAALPFEPHTTATITQHAPTRQVEQATEVARAAGADGVVSFGGGSPIDAAKIVALRLGGLPHVAVPTTLSVAELAAGAGFTDETGNKAGLRDPSLLPRAVFYDAAVTLATPMQLWLSTGIRALDHAVEGFLADGEHPFNDVLALEAIRRLFDSLPRAKADPTDISVRTENQLAAWFSFTLPAASASGLSHMMGKQIGARYGIPHGVTSCLLLPHVMRYLGRDRALPVSADSVEKLVADLDLPRHIRDYGIGEPELRKAASELAGKHNERNLLEIYLAAL
ncbi:MAG TPA: iron-containing alcohol dehydrogenase [Candidatus Dormibacteraeota bacterium]|nr:iron-containing alcohol dehydrogenase [Candidatus Dormibacteraeota bacterium]